MADIVQSFFVVKNIFNYIKISYLNMDVSSVNIFNRPTALHGPRKYTELANDVPNRVHKELYNAAIEKLIDDLDNYTDVNGIIKKPDGTSWTDLIISIIEMPYTEYWRASDVVITFRYFKQNSNGQLVPKLKKFTFDLTPYWGNCYTKDIYNSSAVKFDKNIPNDTEIVKYDYIRGRAVVRSKLEDIEYDVDFDEINNTDVESEDVRLPFDTFTRLVNINL